MKIAAVAVALLVTSRCGEVREASPGDASSPPPASPGVAILSDGTLTLVVKGTTESTSFRGGVGTVKGAGHDVRVEGGWITVDGDRRPLPPGSTITIDVSAERVIVDGGGRTLAFVK